MASGASLNHLAHLCLRQWPDQKVFGFDSFKGLPESWSLGVRRGEFAQQTLPAIESNAELVIGLFQETLPKFLAQHVDPVAFVHLDADVYSSTKYVLDALIRAGRLKRGSRIQFDEVFNYPGWYAKGEFKALAEVSRSADLRFEWIGVVPSGTAAAIEVLS